MLRPTAARPPWALPAILLGAVGVRLALWIWYLVREPATFARTDSLAYHYSARALLETGTFSVAPLEPLVAQTARTPGYPVFLAGVYAALGEREVAASLLQLLLSVATVLLVHRIGRRLWGERAGLWAAALVALDVPSVLFSVLLLTETLFTLAVAAALYSGVRLLKPAPSPAWAPALGAALACMTFLRPAAYYLAIPVALGMLGAAAWLRWPRGRSIALLGLFLAPYVLSVGAWQYRNYRVSGSAAFSQIDGPVLLYYRAAGVLARREGISGAAAQQRLVERYGRVEYPYSPAQNEVWKRAAWEIIRADPALLAPTLGAGAASILLRPAGIPPPRRGVPGWEPDAHADAPRAAKAAGRGGVYLATLGINAVQVAVASLAAALALLRLARARRLGPTDAFLLGVALYLLLVHAGVGTGARFRVQLVPVLALYAGLGLAALQDRRARRTQAGAAGSHSSS